MFANHYQSICESYQNFPSLLKIKNKSDSDLRSFVFQQMKAPEVKELSKGVDIKKAVSVDTIYTKLIKIGADIIAEPLTLAINCFLRQKFLHIMLKLLLLFLSIKENLANMTF